MLEYLEPIYGYKYRKLPSIMGKWYPFFLEEKNIITSSLIDFFINFPSINGSALQLGFRVTHNPFDSLG
jgi:hypothetical protein